MIIRKITLKNFQAHKNLALDLDDFTAIVGPSSAGKSAILRALSWLFYGDWDATYPNDHDQETAVAIQLEDGTIWGRFRKGKRNWAMCRKPGEKPLTYQDFGETIPGILDELNVRPIKLGTGKVNLNFSMQDDPIFMVHESKPAKAQWIGRLYGAHIINQMLRLMAKDKRSIESAKTSADDEESRLRSELAKYDGLEEQAVAIERVGGMLAMLGRLNDCQAQLTSILRDSEAAKKASPFAGVDTDGLRSSLSRLSRLRAAQDAALSIRRDEIAIEQTPDIKADTGRLRADLERLAASKSALEAYHRTSRDLENTERELADVTARLERTTPAIDSLRSEIKKALFVDGRCPLCQGKPKKLDMDSVHTRLRELVS